MSAMGDPRAADGLWNWCIAGHVDPARVRAAVAAALGRPVGTFDAPAAGGDAVLCDVWHVGGDFPTLVDCYLAPADFAEATVASAVAVRLGHDCLLPDDTLNPTRYVLAEPDGTLRAVHVEELETDDGTERRQLRPCTGTDPACVTSPGCGRSRWAPDRGPAEPEPGTARPETGGPETGGPETGGGRAATAA